MEAGKTDLPGRHREGPDIHRLATFHFDAVGQVLTTVGDRKTEFGCISQGLCTDTLQHAQAIEEITHDHGGGGYFSSIQSGDLVTPDSGIDIESLNPQFRGVTQIQAVADLA